MASTRILLIVNLLIAFCSLNASGAKQLLLLSFDGFSRAYLDDSHFAPWFSYFRSTGVFASKIQSVFPSGTYPNHYTLVTGLYPESHGIVANKFYDPKLDASFSYGQSTSYEFWGQAEPLWVTARRQGFKTATSFWPGQQVAFQPGDLTASLTSKFTDEKGTPFHKRIDEALEWFIFQGVDIAFVRFYEPDFTGHFTGQDSEQVDSLLERLDLYLSYLLKNVKQKGLDERLDIVICGDHGMANITSIVYLEDYVNLKDDIDKVPYSGPFAHIFPKTGKEEAVYNALKAVEKDVNWSVYKKEEIPQKLHYSNNDRISPIVVIGKLGVFILPSDTGTSTHIASHGWDPTDGNEEMQPIFMARGPSFRQDGFDLSSSMSLITNKDVYGVICRAMQIDPRPNNSTATVADLALIGGARSRFGGGLDNSLSLFYPLCVILWKACD